MLFERMAWFFLWKFGSYEEIYYLCSKIIFLFGHLQQSHGNENAQIKLFTGKKVARVRTQLGVGNGVFYVPVIGI